MDSHAPSSRLQSWLRTPAAGRPGRAGLRVEQLEDRVVPSSSISLSGLGWTPIGGTILGGNPGQAALPYAGRVSSVSTPAIVDQAALNTYLTNPAITDPVTLASLSPGQAGFAALSNIVYAGIPGGGLAKSTDGGVNWQFLTDNLPDSAWGGATAATLNRNLNVGAVGVSPFNPNLLLVGLGESGSALSPASLARTGTGFLRSTDGGATFALITGPGGAFAGAFTEKFVFHPTNPNIIYTLINGGGGSGVYRSVDAGLTWTFVSTNVPPANPFTPNVYTDFILDPTNPAVSYTATSQSGNPQRGVFRSANFETSGAPTTPASITYTQVIGGTGTQAPGGSLVNIKLAFGLGTPSQPSRIYALSSSGGTADQLFRSDDSGINFRRLDPVPGGTGSTTPNVAASNASFNLELLADPTTPNRIYLAGRGGGSVQVLTNADYDPTPGSGQTPAYVNLTLPSPGNGTTTQVVRDIRFDNTGVKDATGRPVNPGRLIVATDAGLFRFQAPNNGTTTNASYLNNSLAFVSLNGENSGPTALFIQEFFSTALAPQSDNAVIGGTNLNGQGVFADNGRFAAGTAQYNAVYDFTGSTGAESRGDGGNTVYSQLDPNLVYRTSNFTLGTADEVNPNPLFQRSTDGGKSWTTSVAGITNPTLVVSGFRTPTPMIADPSPQINNNEARLFLGTNVVNQSFDGGQTWGQYGPNLAYVTEITSLPRPRISAIGRGRSVTTRIYAAVNDREGTPPGATAPMRFGAAIYRWDEGALAWTDVSPGVGNGVLPTNPVPPAASFPQANTLAGTVTQLIVDPTDVNIVYAITTAAGAGRILRTTAGGTVWTDITGTLPAGLQVYSITQDPNKLTVTGSAVFNPADDDIYLGTSLGVWKLTNPTAGPFTWNRLGAFQVVDLNTPPTPNNFNDDTPVLVGGLPQDDPNAPTGTDARPGKLPDVRVYDVELNTTTGVLSAATLGRGMWQFQIRPFVRGQVYLDQTGNGTLDATTDTPVSGAVVVAIDTSTNPSAESQFANTTTVAQGEYVFRSLPDATYRFDPANASKLLIDPLTKYYSTGNPFSASVNELTFLDSTSGVNTNLFVFDRITISGVAYTDLNGNGVRDAGEGPAANFRVNLVAPAGTIAATPTIVATVLTDANGNYAFDGVGPLRTGLTAVTSGGAPVLNADGTTKYVGTGAQTPYSSGYVVTLAPTAATTTSQTPVATGPLVSGTPTNPNDLTDTTAQNKTRIGVFRYGQLSGSLFDDFNGDGVRQAAEAGLVGQPVQLINAGPDRVFGTGDDTSTATVTGANGAYVFGDFVTGLTAGLYRIVAPSPAGYVQTSADLATVTVTSGLVTPGLNIGEFAAATISGSLYEDVNANGVKDAAENSLVPGLTVQLIDPRTNTPVATAVTDALGGYSFSGLFPFQRPGNGVPYRVRFVSPTDVYTQTSDDASVTVTSGTAFPNTNVGVFRNTTVSGFAFEDLNGDGTRQDNEPGLAGGLVSLLNSQTGAVVYTTTSDAAGNFLFPSVGAIRGPVAFRLGQPAAGFFQTTPSPADFFVQSGTPVGGLVIGLFRSAAFTGTVFEDVNGDGLPAGTDPRLAGQTVQLVNTVTGAVAATATTDATGAYTLIAAPGTYRVANVAPAGFVGTTAAYPAVQVTSGRVVDGQNYGDFRLFTVSGRVFNDQNGNGSAAGDPGLAGVAVQVVNVATGAVVGAATTDANGNYSIPNVGPAFPAGLRVQAVAPAGRVATTATARAFVPASGQAQATDFGFYVQSTISGTVFEDIDRSGTQNAGDVAGTGVRVILLGSSGNTVQDVTTDGNGRYTFVQLAPGAYTVRAVPPAGTSVVLGNNQQFTVTSGQTPSATPIGVLRFASVSGSVFLDPNRNLKRDTPERGAAGAVLGLFSGNTQLATATTDGNGAYTFLNVDSGTFTVRLVSNPTGLQPTGSGSRTVTTAVGSTAGSNRVTGVDFGLTGRDRYALAADGGGGPRVQVYDALSNSLFQDFYVYEETFTGGVRVATGDVNGDGTDDLIVVPGKGGGPRVRVLDGVTQKVLYDYFAYEPTFRNGLFVTSADVNGDGYSDLITGTEAGGGPRVTVFSGRTGTILADFFAFDENFRGGVRVGTGDVDGDGVSEILTSPGAGGGPIVEAWSLLSGSPTVVSSFTAFDPNYTGGLYVAGSTTGPGGRSTIVVGSGQLQPENNVATAVVRVFDAATFTPTAEIEAFPGGVDPNGYRSEVRVASFDRNGDGIPDIAVASGPKNYPRFRFLDGTNRMAIGDEVMPYEFGFTGGIFVG